jgi:hypothetical protein
MSKSQRRGLPEKSSTSRSGYFNFKFDSWGKIWILFDDKSNLRMPGKYSFARPGQFSRFLPAQFISPLCGHLHWSAQRFADMRSDRPGSVVEVEHRIIQSRREEKRKAMFD